MMNDESSIFKGYFPLMPGRGGLLCRAMDKSSTRASLNRFAKQLRSNHDNCTCRAPPIRHRRRRLKRIGGVCHGVCYGVCRFVVPLAHVPTSSYVRKPPQVTQKEQSDAPSSLPIFTPTRGCVVVQLAGCPSMKVKLCALQSRLPKCLLLQVGPENADDTSIDNHSHEPFKTILRARFCRPRVARHASDG